MFVSNSKFKEMEQLYLEEYLRRRRVERELEFMSDKWNRLVNKINSKDGEDFLNSSQMFSISDIKKLLLLCHPDKHGGKQSAVDMTVKILEMRNTLN